MKHLVCHASQIVPADHHKHLCPSCGTCWAHSNEFAGNVAAHTCPSCERLLPGAWYHHVTDADVREEVRRMYDAGGRP